MKKKIVSVLLAVLMLAGMIPAGVITAPADEAGQETAHTVEVIPAKAATCTAPGLTEGQRCSTCGMILTPQEKNDPLGHTFTLVNNGDGSHSQKCSVCGFTGDPAAHSYTNVVIYNENMHNTECDCGWAYQTASGTLIRDSHTFVCDTSSGGHRHICSVCGYEDTNVFTAVSALPATQGNYYLTGDITLTETWNVPSGSTSLCLNGHAILQTADGQRAVYLGSGCELSVYDCDTTTAYNFEPDSEGRYVPDTSGSKTVYGGIICGGSTTDGTGGGCIAVSTSSTLHLYGGTVVGGRTDGCGAGVCLEGLYSYFYMYGGAIIGNAAPSSTGGGVYGKTSSRILIYGGRICNNSAASGGGIGADGTLYIYNGEVSGNRSTSAADGGGGVSAGGPFNMYSGKISGNTAAGNGGGVRLSVSDKQFYFYGGEISGNTAAGLGGGIDVDGGADLQMKTDAVIRDNTASLGGGMSVRGSGSTAAVSGGLITGNTAEGTGSDCGGGGIAVSTDGSVTMTGGEISGNTAAGNGGAVLADNNGTFINNGGHLGDNTAEGSSDGVHVNNNGTVTFTAGRFCTDDTSSVTVSGSSAVTFDMKGGADGTTAVTAVYGQPLPSVTPPAYDGRVFLGYFDRPFGGTKYCNADGTSARSVDYIGAVTLYAQWHIHDFSGELLAGADGTHAQKCACGAYGNTEAHAFTGVYLVNEDGTHSNQCVCGAYGDPAAHAFTGDYKNDGDDTHSRQCACGAYGDTTAHAFTGDYKDNGDGTHSRQCACGAYGDPAAHAFTGDYKDDGDDTHSRQCACGAYGDTTAHVYEKENMADKFRKTPATYTTPAVYYKSCACGACDKSESADTFEGSTLSLFDCLWQEYVEYGREIGRQGKIGEDGSLITYVGRTIIPLTAEQLGEIGDFLTVIGNDGFADFTLTVDCVYTYFYDVTDGKETMITAEDLGYAAFIIIDKTEYGFPVTGYGYFRVYNGYVDEDESCYMFDALYPFQLSN